MKKKSLLVLNLKLKYERTVTAVKPLTGPRHTYWHIVRLLLDNACYRLEKTEQGI